MTAVQAIAGSTSLQRGDAISRQGPRVVDGMAVRGGSTRSVPDARRASGATAGAAKRQGPRRGAGALQRRRR